MADARSTLPDAALVERARRGQPAAFEALVRRHYRAALAVALMCLGNRMDAEDVCHDAFVRALERLEQCRNPDNFAGWLFAIVRNRAHNFREYRRVRTGVSLDGSEAPSSENVSAGVESAELRARLEAALRTLSRREREVVLLFDLEGWDHRAIARALGISEVMSRQHLFKARRALRAYLGPNALKEHTHE